VPPDGARRFVAAPVRGAARKRRAAPGRARRPLRRGARAAGRRRARNRRAGSVTLDLRPVDRTRFPALMERIADAGFHPESEPVPVAPAAHYTMGGVVTDLHGATDVAGLFAAGECACTGVHGAN